MKKKMRINKPPHTKHIETLLKNGMSKNVKCHFFRVLLSFVVYLLGTMRAYSGIEYKLTYNMPVQYIYFGIFEHFLT